VPIDGARKRARAGFFSRLRVCVAIVYIHASNAGMCIRDEKDSMRGAAGAGPAANEG
jgi:hypothetical protein